MKGQIVCDFIVDHDVDIDYEEKVCVEIMDIPYLHGDGIWAEYRILNIDRIFYLYLGFVS